MGFDTIEINLVYFENDFAQLEHLLNSNISSLGGRGGVGGQKNLCTLTL